MLELRRILLNLSGVKKMVLKSVYVIKIGASNLLFLMGKRA